jgi:hypothetical protein
MEQGKLDSTEWGDRLALTGLTTSMTVNALVTGLIVFRIFKVFHEVSSATASDETSLGVIGGRKIRSILFIIIESGMALFAIQLARVVVSFVPLSTNYDNDAYRLIVGIHEMLNVIISSIILYILLMTWT